MSAMSNTGGIMAGNFTLNPVTTLKQGLQADISSIREESSMKLMVSLLEILIDDARKENDRAMIKTILRNQGKIAAFQDLIDIITKDYPGIK